MTFRGCLLPPVWFGLLILHRSSEPLQGCESFTGGKATIDSSQPASHHPSCVGQLELWMHCLVAGVGCCCATVPAFVQPFFPREYRSVTRVSANPCLPHQRHYAAVPWGQVRLRPSCAGLRRTVSAPPAQVEFLRLHSHGNQALFDIACSVVRALRRTVNAPPT